MSLKIGICSCIYRSGIFLPVYWYSHLQSMLVLRVSWKMPCGCPPRIHRHSLSSSSRTGMHNFRWGLVLPVLVCATRAVRCRG